jgi:hypothetical protein
LYILNICLAYCEDILTIVVASIRWVLGYYNSSISKVYSNTYVGHMLYIVKLAYALYIVGIHCGGIEGVPSECTIVRTVG